MLTAKQVGESLISSTSYEQGLLTTICKGYRSRKADNPYSAKVYRNAWQFGFANKHEPLETVEQSWLRARNAEGERLYGPTANRKSATPKPAQRGTAATAEPHELPKGQLGIFQPQTSTWKASTGR